MTDDRKVFVDVRVDDVYYRVTWQDGAPVAVNHVRALGLRGAPVAASSPVYPRAVKGSQKLGQLGPFPDGWKSEPLGPFDFIGAVEQLTGKNTFTSAQLIELDAHRLAGWSPERAANFTFERPWPNKNS